MGKEKGGGPAGRQQTFMNVQLNLDETITHLLVSGLSCGRGGVCWVTVNKGTCGTAVR